ncbi:MAG: DNA mismatch repair endonuclease MutL [Clostridia bacterium]|nr:DNA mismatch repair endonuclease MutL [Clostridia bacterium]
MGNIVLLDDLTINKIAAGEVIERPASVVKELVENSIDAGATSITVEVKNGGISYIRIIDNGKGIMPDDMAIAFERHATSKIRQANDLEMVKSMGFRGEALASIASIAKVTLKSKTEDDVGYCVIVEGGRISEKEETACSQGTMITVENLFYNTPVRYKFLKKDYTEAGYIEDIVTRIALVNPDISIRLINTGKTVIQTSGNGLIKDVIYNIYGKDVAENIIEVEHTYEDIKVKGVIGKPEISRSNRSNQLFFVNKRYVKDRILSSAAEKAFKGMITIGKFGFLILNIEMNPAKVDCNVHPAKLEVRFEDEGSVFKAVYHSIKDNLLKQDYIGNKVGEINEELLKRKNTDKIESIYNSAKDRKIDYNRIRELFKEGNKEQIDDVEENVVEATIDNQNEGLNTNIKSGGLNELQKMFEKIKQKDDIGVYSELDGESIQNETQEQDEGIIKNEISRQDETVMQNITSKQDEKKLEINDNEEKIVEFNEKNEFEKVIKELELRGIEFESQQNKDTEEAEIEGDKNRETKEKSNEEFFEEIKKKIQEGDGNIDFQQMYRTTFGIEQTGEAEESLNEDSETYSGKSNLDNLSLFEEIEELSGITYKFIGIAFSTYIILEIDKDLYILDQHAAHERIIYERIKENYYGEGNKESQIMLLPDIIDLTHKEKMIIQENIDLFEKAGFIIEEFGDNTIKLTGVPNVCIDLDTKELFLETLDEINAVAKTAKQEIEERFIATVACKAAVKANMALTESEVESLMSSLLKLHNPFTCPHGRPTAIKMSKIDIEKKFSRR